MQNKKFSNLYTSFERTGGDYLLSAYFGVDIFSLMYENLKFPTLFQKSDLFDYLFHISVIPKKRNPQGNYLTYYSVSNLEFIAENTHITPQIVNLSGIETDFVYFKFEQLFSIHEVRKSEFEMGVLDISIKKATELRQEAADFISRADSLTKLDIPSAELPKLIELCIKLQGITGHQKEIYNRALKNNFLVTYSTYNLLRTEMLADIAHIDKKIHIQTRNYGVGKKSTAVSRTADPVKYLRNEFGVAVKPNLREGLTSNLRVRGGSLTSVPNQALYTAISTIPTTIIDSLPSLEEKFERRSQYKDDSSLKIKAPNLNLDFACTNVGVQTNIKEGTRSTLTCIESENFDDVRVLLSHSYNSVSSPNFVLISEAGRSLVNNSSYLCKTHYADGENQYFVIET